MTSSELPFVDEHATTIATGTDEVWPVLLETLARTFSRTGAAGFATIVGCADRSNGGPRPLAEGSTTPGFRVASAVPGSELVLEGRHRFSSYALIFRLDRLGPDRSRLRAETRAEFPGVSGGIYRFLVIGTRGHLVAVRRLLSTVKHRSEQQHGGGARPQRA
jgi:hypothetical protein